MLFKVSRRALLFSASFNLNIADMLSVIENPMVGYVDKSILGIVGNTGNREAVVESLRWDQVRLDN